MKISTILGLVLAATLTGGVWWFSSGATASHFDASQYQNDTYHFSVGYPADLQLKEYIPEDAVVGHIQGTDANEIVDGLVEISVVSAEGAPGESFIDAIAARLQTLCAADGPRKSFSCTKIESKADFTTASGISGFELYLHGELKELATGATSSMPKGPYYVFNLHSSNAGSQAVVVHAPLNLLAAEANASLIKQVAQSLVIESSDTVGRYMDIQTFVASNISTLSSVKETLGGTFYVTHIETDGGAGVVSYEDGHRAYTADFTYTIDTDGKPSVDSFTVRGE